MGDKRRAAELGQVALDELDELAAEPTVLEFGRYRVFRDPSGAWIVARAVDTCERCQACGCGDQADLITVPAIVINLAMARANGTGGGGFMGTLKALRARGATAQEARGDD